tara:strand:- start:490 stop:825 length:336 start_codon:yes stop_codon:yes gene_type:complete
MAQTQRQVADGKAKFKNRTKPLQKKRSDASKARIAGKMQDKLNGARSQPSMFSKPQPVVPKVGGGFFTRGRVLTGVLGAAVTGAALAAGLARIDKDLKEQKERQAFVGIGL